LACFNHYQFSTCFRYVSQEAERIQEPH
jgi:hypothetical protein